MNHAIPGGIGGTPPSLALDQFLRQSYDVVQEVHANLAQIRAVAQHLTPVEDLVEFQNEVVALHAKLGVLVYAAELMAAASPAGIDMLLAADAPAQRALLNLQSAALRPEEHFATAAEFDALASSVATLSDQMTAVLADLATKVSQAELTAALQPILDRLGTVEGGDITIIGELNDRLNLLISQLTDGTFGGATAAALDALTTRVGQTEDGLIAEAARTTALEASVEDLVTGVAGNASAVQGLLTRVQSTEAGIDAVAQDITALNTQVTNLETGQSANSSAVQLLQTRTTTNEETIAAHSLALTQLDASIDDTANQVGLATSAINSLETRMESSEAGQLAMSSDLSQLGARVTDTETGLTAAAEARNELAARVAVTEEGITIASEERTSLRSSLTSTGNHVPNSSFAVNTRGWTLFSRGDGWLDAQLERNLAPTAPGALPEGMFALSLTQDEVPAGNAGIRCANIPVEDLKSYLLSGYLAAENCTVRLEWRVLNGAGVEIGFGLAGEVTDEAPSARLSDWTRVHNTIPVAADGAQIQIQLWVTNCHSGFPKAWLLRPQLEPKTAYQNTPSPWMDGVAGIEETFSTAVQTLETRVTSTEDELSTLAQAVTDLDSQLGVVREWRITQHSGSAAYDTVGSPLAPGLRRAGQTDPEHTFQRGLTLIRFNLDGTLASATRYDTYGAAIARDQLRDALLALGEHDAFILVSQDQHGIKQPDLTAALESCGALNFKNVPGTKPYLLIGRGLAGKGGGAEFYPAGSVPWQDQHITVVNDTPKGLNGGMAEVIAANASALETLTTQVTSNSTGLTALASDVTALEARVDTTESNIAGQGTALSDLTVRVTATEDGVTALTQDTTALQTTLTSAVLDIQAQGSAAAALTSRVDATEDSIAQINSDVTALDGRLDVTEANVTAQAGALSTLGTRVTAAEGAITAQSSSITQLTANFEAIGGANLLPNAGMEEAHATLPRPKHWTTNNSAGVTATTSRVSSTLAQSQWAFRAEALAVPVAGYVSVVNTTADGEANVKVEEDKFYTLSSVVKATAGRELRLYVQWRNASNTVIRTDTLPLTIATGGYQRLVFTTPTATPAGTMSASVFGGRVLNNTGAAADLFIEVDNVQLQEGKISTPWEPSTLYGDKVNATAIQALTTEVANIDGEVTALASAQTALTARMADAEGALVNEIITSANKDAAHTASINSLSARMTDAETDITATAGAVSALDTRVSSAEGQITSQAGSITSLQAQVNALDVDAGGSGAAIAALDTRVTAAEGDIDSLSSAVTSLQSSVTNANRVFVQDDPPATAGRTNGDIWIDTNDGNKVYTYNAAGNNWVLRQDGNKNRVFVQTAAPTGANTNDLWFDSDDGYKMYRWTGSAWQEITDVRTAANATAITNLTTRVTAAEGVNTSQANSITALESTVNSPTTGVAATAGALSTLTTRVSDAESDISANASAITSLNATVAGKASVSAVQALEISIGGGGNLLTNSQFSTDLAGWGTVWDQGSTGAAVVRNLAGDDWRPTGINTIGASFTGTPAANNHYMIGTGLIPIEPGKRYCLSAYLAAHRCNAGVYLEFLDQTGTTSVGSATSQTSSPPNNGGRTLAAWDRRATYLTAPSNARWARVIVLAKFTGAESNPYLWACRPMLNEVPATQAIPQPWSAGGAETYAQWNVTLDVNGYVSGLTSVNNGQKADFTILADNFYVIAPGVAKKRLLSIDGTGLKLANDLYIGPGRIVVDTGTHMKVMGQGFGTSNQFIEWYGPKMALNQCSEATAITFIKTNGDAYFGGQLSAGTLHTTERRNYSTLTVGANSSFTMVHRNSVGHTKTVVVNATYHSGGIASFSSLPAAQSFYNSYPKGDTGTINWRLKRAGTQIWSGSSTSTSFANPPEYLDVVPAQWLVEHGHHFSRTATITDSYAIGGDVTYVLEVDSSSGIIHASSGLLGISVLEQ